MSGSRLVVALDYPDSKSALEFVARVTPSQCRLKVGLELFTAAGPGFVTDLAGRGFDVFLDLKFHDIPNTVERACEAAARLGVWMLNVHALGGAEMLRAAREGVERAGTRKPLLIGVTVLTSHSDRSLTGIGFKESTADLAGRLAMQVRNEGLDGVVCSPHEAAALRARHGVDFVLVTPGIRPGGSPADDQRRTLGPAEALARGADYLVVGRPITRAADPGAVLDTIRREIGES